MASSFQNQIFLERLITERAHWLDKVFAYHCIYYSIRDIVINQIQTYWTSYASVILL